MASFNTWLHNLMALTFLLFCPFYHLQSNQLEYATKYYAAILSRATGKPLPQCQEEYLSRRR
jgi:hypothetical protein